MASLKTGGMATIVAATGLGGLGKTQLAVEFVHRYGQYFAGGVFWLSFAAPEAVPALIAACGREGARAVRAAGLPDVAGVALAEQVRLVRAAWEGDLPRLLVFDNCEDQALLERWRPTSGGACVLVTSRRGWWSPALGVRTLALGVLDRAHSVALLRRYLSDRPATATALATIAEAVGDLPLALHLAGSYLALYAHAVTPAAYLALLRNPDALAHLAMPGTAGFSPTGHEASVARTFALSYEELDVTTPADARARALLARAAYFAPGEPIPPDLLLATLLAPGGSESTPPQCAAALQRLVELGLLEVTAGGGARLHRLLVAFVRAQVPDTTAEVAVEHALLETARHLDVARHPAALLPLLPHLRAAIATVQGRADARAVVLNQTLGRHLHTLGDYAGARPLLERALAIREAALPPGHPDLAQSLNDLGMLLRVGGDYAGARPLLERALAISEAALPPSHPDLAHSLHYLGDLLRAGGDYAGARFLLERALAIREAALPPSHPHLAQSLGSLRTLQQDSRH